MSKSSMKESDLLGGNAIDNSRGGEVKVFIMGEV
jgi:hypothetical protein